VNDVLKALSNPIRRDIIAMLRDGPMSAGEIAENFSVSKPTMSVHFAVLRDAELITATRNGTSIIYRLNATVAEDVLTGLMNLFGVGETSSVVEKAKRKPRAVTRERA